GRVAGLNTKPLTAVALQGLLKPLISSVNMVNAPVIARESGIEISETKREGGSGNNYQSLIRVTVTTDKRSRTIAGTIFAG
ncbi:hypothetical protein NL463_29910, partial [Klebsiella pneumoniae]|nr:hypothetical protein [Klebsiella pneumoniae]